MDPVLITIWLVGAFFFIAGMIVDHFLFGEKPQPKQEHPSLLERQVDEIFQKRGW